MERANRIFMLQTVRPLPRLHTPALRMNYQRVFTRNETLLMGALKTRGIATHRGETCIGIQGDNVYSGWRDLLGLETVNDINKSIKKDGLVIQAIVPQGHFERVVDTMGLEWAEHFEGRAYRVNEIDEKYFKHKGEMFLFRDSVYLISMSEELVIEIKHSHIQKMLLLLIQYVQDTARVIDGNEILRELMLGNNKLDT